jgi:hypothetical protein
MTAGARASRIRGRLAASTGPAATKYPAHTSNGAAVAPSTRPPFLTHLWSLATHRHLWAGQPVVSA